MISVEYKNACPIFVCVTLLSLFACILCSSGVFSDPLPASLFDVFCNH